MFDLFMEIWSNPTLFYQKRIKSRQLLKWYKFSSGNFCKCSQDRASLNESFTVFFFWMFALPYTCSWLSLLWEIKGLYYVSIKFNELWCNPKLSLDLFTRLKYGYKLVMTEQYNFNQTKIFNLYVSTFVEDFVFWNNVIFELDQFCYDCDTSAGMKEFEKMWKANFWEFILPTILFYVSLRIAIKSFVMSFFQNWMPTKRYYFAKLSFFILDFTVSLNIIVRCFATYEKMLLDLKKGIQAVV